MISYKIELHDIQDLTGPMWSAHGIECPLMIGAVCPGTELGTEARCPSWSAKFPSAAAEVIYSWTLSSGQSEECGDSVEGNAWYALFRNPDAGTFDGPMGAGVILTELSSGAVMAHLYETTEELDEAWRKCEADAHVCPHNSTFCTPEALCTPCEEDTE